MTNYTQLKDYPNYEVSVEGTIRRIGSDTLLQPIDNGNGYKTVHLSNEKGRRLCLIHRIVLSTFKPIDGMYNVNHIDGDKSNNRLDNLEWTTKSNNTRHAHLTGLFSNRNKLTLQQVREIKELKETSKRGDTKLVAIKYGVSRSVINKIWNGKLYGYI